MSEQIKKVPAVALRGMTILPGMIAHFDVSRERSIHAVEQAMMDDEQIFLVTQRNAEENEPEAEDLYQIGILASIKQVIKMQDNIVRVLVEGTKRAQLQELFSEGTYLAAEVMTFSDTEDLSDGAKEAMLRGVQETFTKYCMANPKMGKEFLKQIKEADDLEKAMDQISNSTSVQQEAEDRLGLVKMDPSQVTYVRLEDESVIERAAGTADKFFAGIKTAALSLLGSFDP